MTIDIKPAAISVAKVANDKTQKPRYKELATWFQVAQDIALGFMFCFVLTLMYRHAVPGQFIYVGTSSIDKGIYWLDTRVTKFNRNDIVSFNFKPTQLWLQARYDDNHYFTKYVGATSGDTIKADASGVLTSCIEGHAECKELGFPLQFDSKGRPMEAWLKPNAEYTLAEGEVWIYAPHPKSLDSRYFGPVLESSLRGLASPLITSSEK